jgi:hypothetical protein
VDALLKRPEADALSAVLEALPQPVNRHEVVVRLLKLACPRDGRLTEREVRIGGRHSGTVP